MGITNTRGLPTIALLAILFFSAADQTLVKWWAATLTTLRVIAS